ncbi:MAG: FtsH protease activity modulator HflK [Verrucomicrobiales bacterium]|nr:FtsH protease activity modulator HflK [Verrucomicrobiales bacterium]
MSNWTRRPNTPGGAPREWSRPAMLRLGYWLARVPVVVVALFLVFGLFSAYYTVPADSEAVVLRFGAYHRTVTPGLRFKLPWGIESVRKLPVKRQLKAEFGFGTYGATFSHQYSNEEEWPLEKRMVTGDLNVVLVEWVVQFRISDPKAFLFHVRDPELTLRDVSEAVMRQVVGDRTVDEVITVGRQEIEFEALKGLQELSNLYELGITIDQVQLKDVNPPEPVQASFNEVNQAQQERERAINMAKGEFNKAIPQARGAADQKIREAEGYSTKRVNEAEGDAARFRSVLEQYVKAPEVTRQRLYLEAIQEVLPRLGKRVVIDAGLNQLLPFLPLGDDSMPAVRRPANPPTP